MTGAKLGERFVLTSYGESHGRAVGAVVEGCPPGLPIKLEEIQSELDLRRPGQSKVTSARSELDRVEILSGIFNDRTTGTPIGMLVWNKDVDSRPYEELGHKPRPGHADLPAWIKYGGFNDPRGGGYFSARLTSTFVMGGVIARKLLRTLFNTKIISYVTEIGGIRAKVVSLDVAERDRYSNEVRCPDPDAAKQMVEAILHARREGDSVGGIIECVVQNLPAGLGEPIFSSIDSDMSRALFSIPAVKGVEFGAGFKVANLRGSENNDQYEYQDGLVISTSNNSGGILGGLTTGMPLTTRIAFKPPSSIARPQRSVNLLLKKDEELIVQGRHDPCVLPRAVPVVDSVVALILADHAIRAGSVPPVLKEMR